MQTNQILFFFGFTTLILIAFAYMLSYSRQRINDQFERRKFELDRQDKAQAKEAAERRRVQAEVERERQRWRDDDRDAGLRDQATDADIVRRGGFQYFPVVESRKRIFVEAMNGFKEYAKIRGYEVDVIIDSSVQNLIRIMIIVGSDDMGVTVAQSTVRKHVSEYVAALEGELNIDDLPLIIGEDDFRKLLEALKQRFRLLRLQNELNEFEKDSYRAMVGSIATLRNAAINYQPSIHFSNQAGGVMNERYKITNSPGAAAGKGATAGNYASEIHIGTDNAKKQEQFAALEQVISRLSVSSLDLISQERLGR